MHAKPRKSLITAGFLGISKALLITTAFVLASLAGVPSPASAGECRTVKLLNRAGFTGNNLRIAYGIVMRESKGQNLSESSPWYSGALGIWQIQTSAHSHNKWWSRAAMLTPLRQSQIVYKYMSKKGTYWRPWGLTNDGKAMDTTHYSGWSSSQQYAWIWAPYIKYYSAYPRHCNVTR